MSLIPKHMGSIVSQLKAAVARRGRIVEMEMTLAEARWVARVLADALNEDRATGSAAE